MHNLHNMRGGARFSADGRYRYWLTRDWDGGAGRLAVIALNPSTADAKTDDPTIRRLCGFAQEQGARGLAVVNLFALCATDPGQLRQELRKGADIVGPENDAAIREQVAAKDVTMVLAAWGNGGLWQRGLRQRQVRELVERVRPLHCLGMNKSGMPRHPLYLPSGSRPFKLP